MSSGRKKQHRKSSSQRNCTGAGRTCYRRPSRFRSGRVRFETPSTSSRHFWANRTYQDYDPKPWGRDPPPFKPHPRAPAKIPEHIMKMSEKEALAEQNALSGDVYLDNLNRPWFQMAAGSTIYHWGDHPDSPTAEAIYSDVIMRQDDTPVFKLISPDDNGKLFDLVPDRRLDLRRPARRGSYCAELVQQRLALGAHPGKRFGCLASAPPRRRASVDRDSRVVGHSGEPSIEVSEQPAEVRRVTPRRIGPGLQARQFIRQLFDLGFRHLHPPVVVPDAVRRPARLLYGMTCEVIFRSCACSRCSSIRVSRISSVSRCSTTCRSSRRSRRARVGPR